MDGPLKKLLFFAASRINVNISLNLCRGPGDFLPCGFSPSRAGFYSAKKTQQPCIPISFDLFLCVNLRVILNSEAGSIIHCVCPAVLTPLVANTRSIWAVDQ